MNVFEISKGELVPGFRIFGVTIVNSEMPFCVFRESVLTNKFVLLLSGGLVLTPRISQIHQNPSLLDQFLSMQEGTFV